MRRMTLIALCVTIGAAAQVYAQTGALPQPTAPIRYVADAAGPAAPQPAFPAVRPPAAAPGDPALAKPAREGGNGKNGGAKNGNGANGEDEGKTLCKQKFPFNIPFGRDPKCGGVKGEVEKELKVKCPPPPEKPGPCPGDYPNGNGNGEEKEEEAPEVGVSDRVWDSVQGG